MSALPAAAGLARGRSTPRSILLFRVAGRSCGIAAAAVVEILAAVAVNPLPRQPEYIAGVIDLRGTIVPVLDLRVRFGLPSRSMELADQLIVVRAAGRLLALWIDGVESFAAHDEGSWVGTGGLIVGDRSLAGVAATDDGLVTIHDVDAFVAQCETDAVFEAAGA